MTEFKTPGLYIGGNPITEQDFSWSLIAGVLPYITNIILPNGPINDAIAALQSPTYIDLICYGGTDGNANQVKLRFNHIYILEPRKIDRYHTLWRLADSRWGWRGQTMYYSYNKTRIKNKKGIASTEPDNYPASIRKQIDQFKVGRYLPWSVKDATEPYNMKEIVERELGKYNIPFDPTISDDAGAYIIENVEANGVDIYHGFANLLASSRLNMGILPSGDVYVYSIDFYDETGFDAIKQFQAQNQMRPGTIYRQDMSRMRPKWINVRFLKKQEVRIVGTTSLETPPSTAMLINPKPPLWSQNDIDNWRVIGCQNVIRVPYPVKSPVTKQWYNIGEYVPMWEYLRAINLSESDVRSLYFSDVLARKFALSIYGASPNIADEQYAFHIISNIKAHYRRVYQIDPWYVDRMEYWEPRRCAVIDNYSHFASPSPLWVDSCVVPTVRHPKVAKRTALWTSHAYNWLVESNDPYRQRPTGGSIVAISPALGIFEVTFPPLIDRVIKQIFPFALDPLPYPALSAAASMLTQCSILPDHAIETLISVVWSTDKDSKYEGKSKYHIVSIDYTGLGGKGPDIEYLSRLEVARFPVREVSGEGGGAINDPSVPANETLLFSIANSESAKLINQFIDRYCGVLTMSGAVPVQLLGNLKAVIYSFTIASGLTTTVDFREVPANPTLEQTLNQDEIDFLRRHVSDGSNKNEVSE